MTPPQDYRLFVSAVSDGRVLVEWVLDHYTGYAAAVGVADDPQGVAQTLSAWAHEPRPEPQLRQNLREPIPADLRAGVRLVTITPITDDELPAHARAPHSARFTYRYENAYEAMPVVAAEDSFAESIAGDIRRSFLIAQQLAQSRWADGAYRSVLETYLLRLRSYEAPEDQSADDHLRRSLYPILDREDYLALHPDAEVRELVRQISAERSELYNWSMDLARGGVARARR